MKHIKVLGTGCANCNTTVKLIEEEARRLGMEIELEKVEDLAEIAAQGVMSTPGVVVDGTLVHAGGLPDTAAIRGWLCDEEAEGGCCSGGSGSSCC